MNPCRSEVPSIPELKRSLAQYWDERSRGFERAQGITLERQREAWLAVADAEGLPETEGSYDRVINRNVLWTLPEPERALADWYRVLKPGGLLVVVDGDWFDDPPSYRIRRFLGSVMILLATRRNPWAARRRLRRGYDGSFEKHLPLRAPGNRRRFPELIAAAGFADVRSIDLPDIDAAEKARLKPAERLVQPNRFFAVTARRLG